MIRIAICSNNVALSGGIEEILYRESVRTGVKIETEVFWDREELVECIGNRACYDLIYLDIETERKNGIEAARIIRRVNKNTLLIILSENDRDLVELFEVEPFRLAIKPVKVKLFLRYFKEACKRIEESEFFYQYTYNKEYRKVMLNNILYFESRGRQIFLFLDGGKRERFYGKLNEIELEVNSRYSQFIRIHQSYLVNYRYIKRVNFSSLAIDMGNENEIILHISQERQKKVRLQLDESVYQEA